MFRISSILQETLPRPARSARLQPKATDSSPLGVCLPPAYPSSQASWQPLPSQPVPVSRTSVWGLAVTTGELDVWTPLRGHGCSQLPPTLPKHRLVCGGPRQVCPPVPHSRAELGPAGPRLPPLLLPAAVPPLEDWAASTMLPSCPMSTPRPFTGASIRGLQPTGLAEACRPLGPQPIRVPLSPLLPFPAYLNPLQREGGDMGWKEF